MLKPETKTTLKAEASGLLNKKIPLYVGLIAIGVAAFAIKNRKVSLVLIITSQK